MADLPCACLATARSKCQRERVVTGLLAQLVSSCEVERSSGNRWQLNSVRHSDGVLRHAVRRLSTTGIVRLPGGWGRLDLGRIHSDRSD